ncbi:hypothetical protein SAMN05216311_120122 [Chitinophaga sp. CF418]|nr:hypothetical protein SAMN05216311_120122 [Chitinophaga sp. CF418]
MKRAGSIYFAGPAGPVLLASGQCPLANYADHARHGQPGIGQCLLFYDPDCSRHTGSNQGIMLPSIVLSRRRARCQARLNSHFLDIKWQDVSRLNPDYTFLLTPKS